MAGIPSKLNVGAKGADQQAKAEAFEGKLQGSIQQPGFRLNKEAANEMPARFIPKDGYDNQFALKMEQLHENTNMYGKKPEVHMEITDQDLAYVERKRKQSNYVRYREWLKKCINFNDPVQGNGKNKAAKKKIVKYVTSFHFAQCTWRDRMAYFKTTTRSKSRSSRKTSRTSSKSPR